jgi:hypothetical protein
MKELIAKDCDSNALHFTTAHFAPSARQSNFVAERHRKEQHLSTPRNHDGVVLPAIVPPQIDEMGATNSSLINHRNSPRRKHDQDLLRQLGRKEYLHQKRLQPSQDDDFAVPAFGTSSRIVGESYYAGPSVFSTMQPHAPDHRRRGGGMKSSFRRTGTFLKER